ncbi:MAG TPA: BlaI/MecI/CopY family transcriptional regulator [Pirellulales bacterium]|nr:BlaI/MecI/CopY family transcriptional regulator [Pirellulales bacterium]
MPRMPGKLGHAELEILQIVQEHQPVTVGDVARQVAADTGKARTTVATMVGRLLRKGFLTRKKVDGKFHYSARLSKTELDRGLVQRFVQRTLGGSLSPFVAYLVEKPDDLTAAEVKRLKQLLRELRSIPSHAAQEKSA